MIDFALVTLDGTKFNQEVYEIIVPTPDGYIAVLPHHIPLVSLVTGGVVSVRQKSADRDDQLEIYAVNGGVINIEDNRVRVLVQEADQSDEINEQAAREAHKVAMELYAAAKDQTELRKAQVMIEHEQARLHVAELRRRKHPPR
jgi:F-type H+-transporting ATPase subunit epsilon